MSLKSNKREFGMSGETGTANGEASASTVCIRADGPDTQHNRGGRRSKASGRDEAEYARNLTALKISPQGFSSNTENTEGIPKEVISDQELISFFENHTTVPAIKQSDLLMKAIALLGQKNRFEEEVRGLRARNESLQELNKTIREKSVRLHAKAEQEEEFISNMLLKRIQKLKNDKEALALKYEQEEEFLTNDLTRKLSQLQNERDELAGQFEAEQSWVVEQLLVKIRKLEAEISANHKALEQLRREKVDLENALEHEQESLFNTLGKRMDQLEAEKRRMQARLDQSNASEEQSPGFSGSESGSHEYAAADVGERRTSRAEVEARKLREECTRQRSVIANLKAHIAKLQQQMTAQETKYVADLLAMREKSAESRANSHRTRMSLETDLARCLETCRSLAAHEAARESDEDHCMASLLNAMSVPKSMTPTPTLPSQTTVSPAASGAKVDSWHDEHTTPARTEPQGDRMEEGSEAADGDTDANMDANFAIGNDDQEYPRGQVDMDDITPSLNFTRAALPLESSGEEQANCVGHVDGSFVVSESRRVGGLCASPPCDNLNEPAGWRIAPRRNHRLPFIRPSLPAARPPPVKKEH